jgi:hypothetical protein
MNTSVETYTSTLAAAVLGLPASADLVLTESNSNGIERPWTANLAKAFDCSREAQREERDGLPYTAAMKWRNAAELFAPDMQAVEHCWREWERIMQIPRRLAGPACEL